MEPDAMILVFWTLNVKPTFSLSSFTLIKRLFSSSSLSAIMVVSSAYLRLLIFFPTFLISAYVSSSQAFHMMYSAYKLNKQGDNIQPWHTPFPILNQSIFPCPVLSVTSWLRISKIWNTATTDTRILNNGNYHSLLMGVQNSVGTLENNLASFYKLLPCSPASLVLIIYTNKLQTYVHPKICTHMFTEVLFIIAKTWKQSRIISPSVGEWIKKCDTYKLWNITQHWKEMSTTWNKTWQHL